MSQKLDHIKNLRANARLHNSGSPNRIEMDLINAERAAGPSDRVRKAERASLDIPTAARRADQLLASELAQSEPRVLAAPVVDQFRIDREIGDRAELARIEAVISPVQSPVRSPLVAVISNDETPVAEADVARIARDRGLLTKRTVTMENNPTNSERDAENNSANSERDAEGIRQRERDAEAIRRRDAEAIRRRDLGVV